MIGRVKIIQNNGKEYSSLITKNGSVTFGRGRACDIKILDTRLSRIHCKVIEEDGKYFLVDAGSTNGTFLNNEKVDRVELADGDILSLGTSKGEFSFVDESDTKAEPGPGLQFCLECDGSIPKKDIEKGSAKEAEGGYLCKDCALAKDGIPLDVDQATEKVDNILQTPDDIPEITEIEAGDEPEEIDDTVQVPHEDIEPDEEEAETVAAENMDGEAEAEIEEEAEPVEETESEEEAVEPLEADIELIEEGDEEITEISADEAELIEEVSAEEIDEEKASAEDDDVSEAVEEISDEDLKEAEKLLEEAEQEDEAAAEEEPVDLDEIEEADADEAEPSALVLKNDEPEEIEEIQKGIL